MKKGSRFWPVAGWVFPVFPALSFYWNRWDAIWEPYTAAVFFGFLGFFYLLNTLIISSRIRYFDRLYGHGKVLTFRTIMAWAALVLILVHRHLKFADGDLVPTGQIMVGKVALVSLFITVVVAVFVSVRNPVHKLPILRRFGAWLVSRSKLDFGKLKIMQSVLPIAGIAAAAHVMLIESSAEFSPQMIIPAAYILCALWFYIRFRIIRPVQLRKHSHTVSEVHHLAGNLTEIRMTGDQIGFKAGQYAYWRIFSEAVGRQEHAFTISSTPGDEEIGFCVEASGHYRSALGRVRVGETAIIDGPYGIFTLPDDESIPVLFIAGDIGISPFRSMLTDMANNRSMRPVTLIWSVKSREDLVYDAEILRLAKRLPSFRYKPVIDQHVEMQGDGTVADFESGYITKGLIRGLNPDLKNDRTLVYIRCPDSMEANLNRIFKSIGVPRRRVIQEKINLE